MYVCRPGENIDDDVEIERMTMRRENRLSHVLKVDLIGIIIEYSVFFQICQSSEKRKIKE